MRIPFDPGKDGEMILAKVMNNNKKKAHKLIGQGEISIENVEQNVYTEIDLELQNSGKPAGSLKLRITKENAPPKDTDMFVAAQGDQDVPEEASQTEISVTGETIPGILTIEVMRGVDLKKVQRLGSQDPYVKVSIGEATKKTGVASGTNPTWKSAELKLDLSVVSGTDEEVKIEVFDAETVMKDRIIGRWVQPLAKLLETRGEEQSLELSDPKGKRAGTLIVRVSAEDPVKSQTETAETSQDIRQRSSTRHEEQPDLAPEKPENLETPQHLPPGHLKVTVVKGVQLKKVQMVGKQDPYVVAKLLPWEITAAKTKCASGVNPVWSSGNVIEFDYPGNLPSTKLEVTVYDAELVMKDRLIGSGVIADLYSAVSASEPVEVKLQDAKGKPAGTLITQLAFEASEAKALQSRIVLEKAGTLQMTNIKASLTRSVETLSKQDPFLEVTLMPWAGTAQIGNTKSLHNAGKECDWKDESIEVFYPGKPASGEASSVRVRVYDDETLMKDRLIGDGTLPIFEDVLSSELQIIPITFNGKAAGTVTLQLTFHEGKRMDESRVDVFEAETSSETQPSEFETAGDVFLRIDKALKLKNRALFGKQDPYVRATLLPCGETSRTREVPDGGTSVEFLDTHGKKLRLKYPGGQQAETPLLLLQVMDQQIGKDRLIGERHVGPSCFLGGVQKLKVPLLFNEKPAGTLEVEINFRKRGPSRGCRAGVLKVDVISVSLNHGDDLWSKCDPYVSLTPWPSTIGLKRYTSVVRANAGVAAAFQERIEVPLFDFDLDGPPSSLRVQVFDRDVLTKDDLLGSGLLELEEVLAGEASSRQLEVTLRTGRKDVGHALLRMEFTPSPHRGEKLPQALRTGPGFLRVWVLEARQLRDVTGVLDFKMDPYLAVHFQDPGATVPSMFKLRTNVADDAGTQCVWNTPIDVPYSSSNAAWASAGQVPGFLHVAVFDANVLGDKLVGRKVIDILKPCGDTWVTLMDAKGNKAGEVRIGLDYVKDPSTHTLKAASTDLAFTRPGSLHLFVGKLSDVPPQVVSTARLELRLGDRDMMQFESQPNNNGAVNWTQLCEVPWEGSEGLPPQPVMVNIVVKHKKNRTFGYAELPLDSFVDMHGSNKVFQHTVPVLKSGSSFKETSASLTVTGFFLPQNSTATAAESVGMLPLLKVYDEGGTVPPEISMKPLSGRLHVRVLEAKGLKGGRSMFGGKADPYVQGTLRPGGTTFKTGTCTDGGRSAKWTEAMKNEHELLVSNAACAVVDLTCMDADDMSKDDLLGCATIPIHSIARWLALDKAKQSTLASQDHPVWRKLLDQRQLKHDSSAIAVLLKRIVTTFETSKWQQWSRKAFKAYMEVSAGHDAEESEVERQESRAKQLRSFYNAHTQLSKEEIEKKIEKINLSANNEPTNKVLWHKLYKKYEVAETCPDSLWQDVHRTQRHEHSEPLQLTPEVIGDVVDYIDSRANQVMGRSGDTAVTEDGLEKVEDDLTTDPCMKSHTVLDMSAFEAIAQTVMAEAIIEDSITSQTTPLSMQDHDLDECPEGSKTLWWDLLDKHRKKPVGSAKLQLWFTDDWTPPSRGNVPLPLLQDGDVWIDVVSASVQKSIGKQDLYVRSSYICGKGSELSKRQAKTPVVKNSGGPGVEWPADGRRLRLNYDTEAAQLLTAKGQTPLVHIELLDKDSLSADDVLGEVKLPLLPLAINPNSILGRELSLINTASGETTRAGTLSVRLQFLQKDGESAIAPFEADSNSNATPQMSGELVIVVGSARGVKGADRGGTTVVLRLWPNNEVAVTKSAKREAIWKEELVLSTEDAGMAALEVTMKRNKKEIGTFTMCLHEVLNGPIEGWFELVDKKLTQACGELQLRIGFNRHDDGEEARGTAVRYVAGPGTLHMKVLKASGLKSVVLTGTQDPYVQIKAVRWRTDFETKTEVDENGGRTPSFMFGAAGKLEWDPKDKDCPSVLLELKHSGMMSSSPIGKILLPVSGWLLCPGQVSYVWLPVSSGGTVLLLLQYLPTSPFAGKPSRPLKWTGVSETWPEKGDVHVQVLSARNLLDVEALGKQDPYVKLTLFTGGATGSCHAESAKTRTVDNGSTNPKWGEDLLLAYTREEGDDASSPVLLLEVMDKNKLRGDCLIGRTMLPIFPFLLEDGQVMDQWLPLVRNNGAQSGQLHLGLQFRREGEGKRLLASESPENVLNVVLLRGQGLVETEAKQDPQVWVEFIGQDHVVKTKVASNQGSEPIFDERVHLPGCLPDARGIFPRLRCTVVDVDSLSSSDLIGVAEVSLTQKIMDGEATKLDLPLYDVAGQHSRGVLQVILKRGPFPGDIVESEEASSDRKVLLMVEEIGDLVNAQGRAPTNKIFVRATSHGTKRDTPETKKRMFDQRDGGLVVPAPSLEQKQAVTLAVYSRKWGLLGFKPVLLGKAVVGLKKGLEQVPIDVSIRREEAGPALGNIRGWLQVLPLISGHFRVHVSTVKDISKHELIGQNDLRVDVSIQNGTTGERVCTSVKQNTGATASFNETLSLVYSNQNERRLPHLVFMVVEVDALSTTNCGKVEVPVCELVVNAFKAGVGGSSRMETRQLALDQGAGNVEVSIEFFPDSGLFKKEKAEESRATMELKRMWNMIDTNGDGCLSVDELRSAVKSNAECVSFLGSNDGEELFREMNTNGDDIVDFQEFRQFIENKPDRDKARKEARWRREQAQEAERFRLEKAREEKLKAERARRQAELEAKIKLEKEQQAKVRAAQRKKANEALRRREAELAQAALKRSEKEMNKLEQVQKNKPSSNQRRKAPVTRRPRPVNVMQWRTRDVVEWITNDLDLPEYAGAFAEGAVDGPLLLQLTDEDLKVQLKIPVELHRRKVLIRALRLADGTKPRATDTKERKRNRPQSRPSSRNRDHSASKLRLGKGLSITLEEQKDEVKDDPFEYTSPPRDLSSTSPDLFEWFEDGRGWKEGERERVEDDLSEDESSEEEFRKAMIGVRRRIQQNQLEDAGVGLPSKAPNNQRDIVKPVTLPESATDEELVEVLKQKIVELASKHGQGLSCKAALKKTFKLFCGMRSEANASGRGGLSRLKFKGAVLTLLGVDLSWIQLDRVFRRVARSDGNARGDLVWADFYASFRFSRRPARLSAELQQLLFATCLSLVKQRISLKEAFLAFDMNGSGFISLSEFTSLLRSVLGRRRKTDEESKLVYRIFTSIDQDFDRKISLKEFLQYWLMVFHQWTSYLHTDHSGISSRERRRLLSKINRTMKQTFGHDFATNKIPGPSSSLLRKAAVSPEVVENSFIDLESPTRRRPKLKKVEKELFTGSGHVAARVMRQHREQMSTREHGRQVPVRKMRFDPYEGLDLDIDDY